MCEIKWVPAPGDGNWFDTKPAGVQAGGLTNQQSATVSNLVNYGSKGAITLSAAGLPANTGVRIRFVAVYEWLPAISTGLVSTFEPPVSANDTNDVLRALFTKYGPKWFLKGAATAMPYVKAIAYGASKVAAALL